MDVTCESMSPDVEVSVVIPTLDVLSERAQACIRSVRDTLDVPYEIVIVDNGGCPRGVSAPTNAAFRAACGKYIVFCSDDVILRHGWWEPLRIVLDRGALVAYPHTDEGFMRYDFAAWCFAISNDSLPRISSGFGIFDERMMVWYQDTDLLRRLEKLDQPPVYVADSHILHGLSKTIDAPENLDWVRKQIELDQEVYMKIWGF